MDAKELLDRYAEGDRHFAGADLSGVNLNNAHLVGIDNDNCTG